MEKTKKLSKSSIAVIVLAILLALSMIMGITGAWFTDRAGQDAHQDITFGKVSVKAEGEGAEGAFQLTKTEYTTGKFVPGDKFTVDDVTITNDGDVPEYVHYSYVLTIKTNDANAWDVANLKTAATAGENVFVRTGLTDATELLKEYAAGASEEIAGGDIVMNINAINVAYDQENKIVYVLNAAYDEEALTGAEKLAELGAGWTKRSLVDVQLRVNVEFVANAIQRGNMTVEGLNSWLEAAGATNHAYTAETMAAIPQVNVNPGS